MISSKLARSTLRLIGICCALTMLSACERSMEDILAEQRPAVEEVFGKLKALQSAAQKAPSVTEDRMQIGAERVVLEGKDSNALFILAHNLAAPESATSEMTGARRASAVTHCGELLRGEFHGAPAGATHFLTECGNAKYVFVLRTATDVPPQLVDQKTFQQGIYEGDVLLFRLADGALLGGFRVSAKSSDTVVATADSTGISLDVIDRLEDDLNLKVLADIDAKLRKHVPGVIP